MRQKTTLTLLLSLFALGGTASADESDATKLIRTDTKALDQLALATRDQATMDRPTLERDANVAPTIVQEEVFEEQRLPQSVVQRVLGEHVDEVSACYDRFAQRNKAASGEVSLAFVVEPKGHVTHIVVSGTIPNARPLQKCIAQRVKKWKFPAADAETEVEIPFSFNQAGAGY